MPGGHTLKGSTGAASACRPHSSRIKVLRTAFLPTVRTVSWTTPAAVMSLAVLAVSQQRLAHPQAFAESFTVLAQLLGACAAVAITTILTEAADNLLDASPTTRRRRFGLRLSMLLLTWVVIWGMTIALVASAPGPLAIRDLTCQALVLLSLAAGAAMRRGPAAAAAVVAAVVVGSNLLPESVNILGRSPATRWRLAGLGSVGVALIWWDTRDRAGRHLALRPRRSGQKR